MIDFKKWQQLNESLGYTNVLGLTNKAAIGGIQGAFQYIDEKKKHMHGDVEMDDEDALSDDAEGDLEDEGDEEMVDDEDDGGCGDGAKFCKKKMKKKMKKHMKNECDCLDKAKSKGKDMGDEDADVEDAEEEAGADLDGDGEEGEPMDHKKKVMPLGFMKKKMNKKMKKESTEDWMKSITNGYASEKNQTDDEDAFWNSLKGYNYNPNQKFSDGFSEIKEDLLIPQEPAPAAPQQAQPGEVGFAPQQRMGAELGGGYEMPPLEEGKKPFKSWLNS